MMCLRSVLMTNVLIPPEIKTFLRLLLIEVGLRSKKTAQK